jgi:hypothetical protein
MSEMAHIVASNLDAILANVGIGQPNTGLVRAEAQ